MVGLRLKYFCDVSMTKWRPKSCIERRIIAAKTFVSGFACVHQKYACNV